ncbi:hypothetical protein C0J52_14710 [Blattella germanica]|nr:hypothetical protein C0J52_14710 [Blattella germanica]
MDSGAEQKCFNKEQMWEDFHFGGQAPTMDTFQYSITREFECTVDEDDRICTNTFLILCFSRSKLAETEYSHWHSYETKG